MTKLKLIIGGAGGSGDLAFGRHGKILQKTLLAREQIKNLLIQIKNRNKMVLEKANDYASFMSEQEYDRLVEFTHAVTIALRKLEQGD